MSDTPVLKIKNLQAKVAEDELRILTGLDLEIKPGEIHAIMGPNASGKSTLAKVLAGHPGYEATAGSVVFQGEDLLELEADERSQAGLFLAFQYPVEIPGVNSAYFMRSALNELRKARGQEELDALDFLTLAREKLSLVEMDESFINRSVNEGFSGGEKKRHEIFQMAVLEPRLAVMDETDSGLDIDALRIVAKGVNSLHSEKRAVVVVTHYQRLLEYIVPDFVHVMLNGKIVKSSGKDLALELEEKGYDWVREEHDGVTA